MPVKVGNSRKKSKTAQSETCWRCSAPRRFLRRRLRVVLLLPVSLLYGGQSLQLFRLKYRLDPGHSGLADFPRLLLLLLHGKRSVVANRPNLFILFVHDGGDFLFLVWRQLQFIVHRRPLRLSLSLSMVLRLRVWSGIGLRWRRRLRLRAGRSILSNGREIYP